MAVMADPGVGKTDLVGSCQELGKTLIIRPPHDQTNSILNVGPNIEEEVIHDWGEMNDMMDMLRSEGGKYAWVWVDSWSLMQDVLMDDIWESVVNLKPARYNFGLDKGEYGVNMHREGIWMRHVIGADLFNFGWTAHPMILRSPQVDADGDPIEKLMPWVQGKQMSQKFCAMTGLVCWIDKTAKGKRVLKATADEVHYAKDQYDAIPEKGIVLPRGGGMAKVTDLIYKSRPALKPGSKTATATKKRRTTRKGR
jgi:hypothetical protein